MEINEKTTEKRNPPKPDEHGLEALSSYYPPMAGIHANQLQEHQNPMDCMYLGDGGFMKRRHAIAT